VRLIEDMAHAAYADLPSGDFAVTSLVKFLPVSAGAELLFPDSRAATWAVEKMHRRLPGWRIVALKRQWHRVIHRLGVARLDSGPYRYFDYSHVQRGLPHTIDQVVRNSDHAAICSRRQNNFRYLSSHLQGSVLGKPLFDTLPDHVVPYMFPFKLADANSFEKVRQHAIQALRWEEIAPTPCKISSSYRSHLIQLPVHQCIDKEQLHLMIDCLAS